MKTPQSKYNYFGVVINAKKNTLNTLLELKELEEQIFLHFKYKFFATIIHDKDIKENGQPKTEHLHAYISTDYKYTEKQMLKDISNTLQIETEQISIEGSNNEYLLCQYLTHQNHKEKHQYSASQVSAINDTELDRLLNETRPTKKDQLTLDLETLEHSKTIIEVAHQIGLEKANKYRNIFNQIKAEKKQDLDNLIKELTLYRNFVEDIIQATKRVFQDKSIDTQFYKLVQDLYQRYFEYCDYREN